MNIAQDIPAWLLILLALVATARLTRLVTADYVTRPVRRFIDRRWGEESWQSYLSTCDWCASIHTGGIVATAITLWPENRVVIAALVALAGSYVTGLAAQLERSE